MLPPFMTWIRATLVGAALVPPIAVACSVLTAERLAESAMLLLFLSVGGTALAALAWSGLERLQPWIDDASREQLLALDAIHPAWRGVAIIASAAASLTLELGLIRWQTTLFETFSLYKNFTLLAAFVGLGAGYALADRNRIPLVATLPLLAVQTLLLTTMKYAFQTWQNMALRVTPISEQLNISSGVVNTYSSLVGLYTFLAVVFLLTMLAFLPVGQLCGRAMRGRDPLRAYGENLLGSLVGVVLILVVSFLWTPPLVWFAPCWIALCAFQAYEKRALAVAAGAVMLTATVLVWPVMPGWERIYSPYQLLERGPGEQGLMMIRVAGNYFQRVHDLSFERRNSTANTTTKVSGAFYDLPYALAGKAGKVAIVGAGAGNDVAAALRAGATSVDAIEIDPAIQQLGRLYHPENPYGDPRTHAIVNDARSFLRSTLETYDMVVYGLLDSHTLLSHAANVRVDSYVYTVEGLREARQRLVPNGVLALSFAVVSDEIGRKLHLMLQDAFDGQTPVCLRSGYDKSTIFIQRAGGTIPLPANLLKSGMFRECGTQYTDPSILTEVSTDDWPFFYMPQRKFPVSFLPLASLMLVLTYCVLRTMFTASPSAADAPWFLLGAGFMLIQTKGITELGLAFGNTWQVIGIVIVGLLGMAWLANSVVSRLRFERVAIPYALLIGAIALGWFVSSSGGFSTSPIGKLATTCVLTLPMFFSGIVFSTLLRSVEDLPRALAANLLGAMLGGLLEYNAMYFGYRFLYVLAAAIYALAFLNSARRPASAT